MSEPNPAPAGVTHTSFPAGARCARHPEREASATCTRCGDYMCSLCDPGAPAGLCPGCAQRVGPNERFALSRHDYTFGSLFRVALDVWRERWGKLALVSIAFFVVVYVPALLLPRVLGAPNDPSQGATLPVKTLAYFGVMQLVSVVLDSAATLVMTGYLLDLLERKPGTMATRFARLRALPAQLGALLLIYLGLAAVGGVGYVVFRLSGGFGGLPQSALITGVLALCAVPVLVYVSLGFVFITFSLAHDPALSALGALRASWELVGDKRASVAVVLTLNGLITMLGALTCLVGVVFTFPLGMLCYCALFLALRQR